MEDSAYITSIFKKYTENNAINNIYHTIWVELYGRILRDLIEEEYQEEEEQCGVRGGRSLTDFPAYILS